MIATVEQRDAHGTAVRLDTGRGHFTAETSASVPIDTGVAPWVPATYALAMRVADSLELRAGTGVTGHVDREQRAGAAAAGAMFASSAASSASASTPSTPCASTGTRSPT